MCVLKKQSRRYLFPNKMKIAIALVMCIGINCRVVITSDAVQDSVKILHANETKLENKIKSFNKAIDEKEILETAEDKDKNLTERSYIFIDRTMKKAHKTILTMKLEKLTNSYLPPDIVNLKPNLFPNTVINSKEQQFVPNDIQYYQSEHGHDDIFENNNKYTDFELQQERSDLQVTNKPNDIKAFAKRPHNYDSDRIIKHKVIELHHMESPASKRRFPFTRHRINANYAVSSFPIRRSPKQNFQNKLETDDATLKDKYDKLLENIGKVIEMDVDDNTFGNSNINTKCKNCYNDTVSEMPTTVAQAKVIGCKCKNIKNTNEPWKQENRMFDENETFQSTTDGFDIYE